MNINKITPNFLFHEGYSYLEHKGEFFKGCKRCGGEGHRSFNGEHSRCYDCDDTAAKLGAQFPDEQAAQKWCHEKSVRRGQRERKAEAIRMAAQAERKARQEALKASDLAVYELLMGIEIGDEPQEHENYESWAASQFYTEAKLEKNPFLRSMAENLRIAGNEFTPNMLAALHRAVEQKAARAAESEANPVVEGRQVITGEVLSAKTRESDYGTQYKILVKDDRGFKVYASIPKAQADEAFEAFSMEIGSNGHSPYDFGPACWFLGTDDSKYTGVKGRRITFTATVEVSQDDNGFGFGSRPTKGAWL